MQWYVTLTVEAHLCSCITTVTPLRCKQTGYASMSYYEKWASASAAIAIERGTFTHAELDAQMGPDPATLDNTAR